MTSLRPKKRYDNISATTLESFFDTLLNLSRSSATPLLLLQRTTLRCHLRLVSRPTLPLAFQLAQPTGPMLLRPPAMLQLLRRASPELRPYQPLPLSHLQSHSHPWPLRHTHPTALQKLQRPNQPYSPLKESETSCVISMLGPVAR